MWAKACEKRRQLTELQETTKDTQTQLKSEEDSASGNSIMKDTLTQSIENKKDAVSTNQEKLKKLDLEIRDLEKRSKDYLLKMKKELDLSKKQLRTYGSEKT
jgi:hypothetical protein